MRNTDKLGLVVPTNKATENFSTQDYVDNFDKIDNFAAAVDTRIDNIVATPVPVGEVVAQEIIDARQGNINLGANFTGVKNSVNSLLNSRITGNNNKKYKVVAGCLRNTAGVWSLIEDATHTNINIASVSQTSDDIRINYNIGAVKNISLVAVADETYIQDGLTFGTSVGTTFTNIRPIINKHIGGYISYNGSSWVISNAPGVTSAVWSTDKLVITHGNMYQQAPNIYNAQVTHRDGNYVAQLGSFGLNTIEVKFYDFSGNLITTPNTNMKIYFNRTSFGAVRTQDLMQNGSNIWIFGIFEVE